jgi:integrase
LASITKTKTGYRAQIYYKGHRDSNTLRTKREAEAWAFQRVEELKNNAVSFARHSLGDAIDRYVEEVVPTKRGNQKETIRFEAMKRDLPIALPLAELTPEIVAEYRDKLLKRGLSAGSVLRYLGQLSSMLETARREWRWITSNPVRDVRKPRAPDHREVTISNRQIKLMLRALGYSPVKPVRTVSQSCAAAFLFALRSGMRAGEICGLTWANVHADYCRLPVTKTKPRDVPLMDKAVRILDRMRGFDDVLVFGIKSQTLDALFRKARVRAGLSGFTFHDARHTAATRMAKMVDVLTLCKIFGWSNTSQALTYYNPKASDIAKRLSAKRGQSQ